MPAALHALQVDEHGQLRPGTAPTITQVLRVFQDRYPAIRARLLDGGDDAEYNNAAKRLQRRLLALCAGVGSVICSTGRASTFRWSGR